MEDYTSLAMAVFRNKKIHDIKDVVTPKGGLTQKEIQYILQQGNEELQSLFSYRNKASIRMIQSQIKKYIKKSTIFDYCGKSIWSFKIITKGEK